MTKVLHVIASVNSRNGGPTFALMNLVEMLKSSSVRCGAAIALSSEGSEQYVNLLSAAGAEVYQWPAERFSPYSFSASFSRNFHNIICQYDVLHIHSMWNWPVYFAASTAQRLGIPVIFRPAGALDYFDVRKHSVLKRMLGPLFLRKLFMPPNIFHCTAQREATNLVSYGGSADRVVLPLPVAEVTSSNPKVRTMVRGELGIPARAPVLLFMGRIDYKKGLEELVPAIAEVRNSYPDLHFVLAGDGSGEIVARVKVLLSRFRIEECTRIAGFVTGERKVALLAACDLFVLASRNENFGVSVVEALSAGMPVVITEGVYISDDIGSELAVCVCRGSMQGVAAGILEMLKRMQAANLREQAKALWQKRYSFATLTAAYEKLYQEVAKKTVS